MYELHIINKNYSSWSLRPWVLMRALRIDFTERLHQVGAESLTAFSPTGRVPCLVHDGLTVWDSLAITEYLAERHAGAWSVDPKARAWARSAAAEIHSGFQALRSECSMSIGVRVRLHQHTPALKADLARLEALWVDGLERFGGPFLAGAAFSAADAFYAPVAFRVQSYGLSLGDRAMGWVQRVLSLAPMREWEAAGVAEVWRDAKHDEEVLAMGTITADLRAV